MGESQRQRVERHPFSSPVIADVESMCALWAVTMIEVLNGLPDDETLLVSHAALLADARETLKAAATFCGLPASGGVEDFASTQVKPSLYRARAGADRLAAGGWLPAAHALFEDLERPGTPRLLSRIEARRITSAQDAVHALLPGLPAVRASINRLRTLQFGLGRHTASLNSFIWILAALAIRAPAGEMAAAVEKIQMLADDSGLEKTNFAFAHSVGRLLMILQRKQDAQAWMDRIRPEYAKLLAFQQLEAKINDLPCPALCGTADLFR